MKPAALLLQLLFPPRGTLFLSVSKIFEPLKGIEPLTSSLPRKCSTTELQRRNSVGSYQLAVLTVNCRLPTEQSGRRGSNSPPIAWKAIALPNELLPLLSPDVLSTKVIIFYSSIPETYLLLCDHVGRGGFEPP